MQRQRQLAARLNPNNSTSNKPPPPADPASSSSRPRSSSFTNAQQQQQHQPRLLNNNNNSNNNERRSGGFSSNLSSSNKTAAAAALSKYGMKAQASAIATSDASSLSSSSQVKCASSATPDSSEVVVLGTTNRPSTNDAGTASTNTAAPTTTNTLRRPTLLKTKNKHKQQQAALMILTAQKKRQQAQKKEQQQRQGQDTTITIPSDDDDNDQQPSSPLPAVAKKTTIRSNLQEGGGGEQDSNAAAARNRRNTGGASSSGALAQLVQNLASTQSNLQKNPSDVFPTIEADDFWKHLRNWDFCTHYATAQRQQQKPQSNKKDDDDDKDVSEISTLRPLPNVFFSSKQYVALWAPLVLAECRAQILQEVQSWPRARQKSATLAVQVEVMQTDFRGGGGGGPNGKKSKLMDAFNSNNWDAQIEAQMEAVHLKLNPLSRGGGGDGDVPPQVLTGDLCLLVEKSDFLERPPSDGISGRGRGGLVGHAEVTRTKGMWNNLIVKVSRRKWIQYGPSSSSGSSSNRRQWDSGGGGNGNGGGIIMYLVVLGANVTSLREFTALTQIHQLPLLRFLLAEHLDQTKTTTTSSKATDPGNEGKGGSSSNSSTTTKTRRTTRITSTTTTTDELLERIGGSEALGKGFIDYASKKFNASQLKAIAASAHEYGEGGFTLIKGPPGTGSKWVFVGKVSLCMCACLCWELYGGTVDLPLSVGLCWESETHCSALLLLACSFAETTTLVAVLNSLHIRQYNKYYAEVRRIATQSSGSGQNALQMARKAKPRLLVCAPSNAAVDNIILKIMQDGFIDGQGQRYNPSMLRVGVGQSAAVRAVALETKVETILGENLDIGRLDSSIAGYRMELSRITQDMHKLRQRVQAMTAACSWPLSRDWEVRVEEDLPDQVGRIYFVNHRDKTTTYEVPPPPEPDETQFPVTSMPEYRAYVSRIVKLVENYFSIKTHLERCTIVKGGFDQGANHHEVRMNLESHVLNDVHIVMTTLGTAGNRTLESVDKFEVVVVDEAAQSVEPATLSALQLGSRHAVLVGDPQQLPATIFNVSGRNSKFDRSLFQRLEEAGQPVYMLNEQYRMHPEISHFPRHIFYGGNLLDGPNVKSPNYGNRLRAVLNCAVPQFKPFTILDLDSTEERGGTSLSNRQEALLTVFLYQQLREYARELCTESKVAVITPYAQQCNLLRRLFSDALGPSQFENWWRSTPSMPFKVVRQILSFSRPSVPPERAKALVSWQMFVV